jgi:ribose-phosphate pyrophosphokinase
MPEGIRLISGNSNRGLAYEVANYLDIPLTDTTVMTFSDGELFIKINENIRGSDTFIIQSTCNPVNTNIMELLLIIDALKRASAGRITAVIPYYGYGRQDRKVQPRVPISSKLVADILEVAGADRILTIDLHAGQIQGFFNIPVDHLYATPPILEYVKKHYNSSDLVLISPDAGGVERARAFARNLNTSLAIIDKRREVANVCEVMNVIGDVKGKAALILDDMIDTAGTTVQAAEILMKFGATSVSAACTHAVLSGPAIERINNSLLEEVIVTNTIPLEDKVMQCKKIKVISIAYLLGEAIKRIHEETSVESLFLKNQD